MINEIRSELHLERGILHTVKVLITNPGKHIREYLTSNRKRLVKPVIFIIITSLLYTLVNNFFHIEESHVKHRDLGSPTATAIFRWVQENYGYANIIMGVFIAWWVKLFFRKPAYNFYEILVLLCFSIGMGMLIFTALVLVQGLVHVNVMTVAGFAGIAYPVWAIGQVYEKQKLMSYVKALLAYLLGMSTFWMFAFLAGTVIDFLIKPV
jgi:hypothetical protein